VVRRRRRDQGRLPAAPPPPREFSACEFQPKWAALLFLVRHRARRTPWGACSDDFGTQRLCARTATRCDSAPPPPAAHQQIASHTPRVIHGTHRSLFLACFFCVSLSLALDFSPTRTETTWAPSRIINGINGSQRQRVDLTPYRRDSKRQKMSGNWRL
jgi:hypothetical protein